MFGYIDPFYEAASRALEPGHVWCDQPVYLPPRNGLKFERVGPADDADLELAVCARTAEIFAHPPIHSMTLDAGEGAVVTKTKRDRPVIVLGGTTASEMKRGKTSHAGTVMVVPVYGADQYDEQTRRRMANYDFTNVFYLPANDQPRFDEGFARLDHAQPIFQAHLTRHRGLKLSDEALEAILEWFVAFTIERIPPDSLILEYRRERLAGG